jgi:hypothetical protein
MDYIHRFLELVLAPPIIAACLAAILSGYLVSRWKGREDAIEKRLDEIIEKVDEIATCASEYWQLAHTDPKVKIEGVKVRAGIARLDGLRSALRSVMSAAATEEISLASSDFLRSCTGGDFGVHNRSTDLGRASEILLVAASLSVAIRSARMKDLQGWRRRT